MKHIWQSTLWPKFDYDRKAAEPHLAAAVEAMGEVSGLQAGLDQRDLEELRLSHIVQEALASFGIEGVALDPAEIEASVIASLNHRDRAAFSRRSDAIVELMVAARQADGPLTKQILWEWHRLLFFGIEVEDLGRWRQFEIDIVRSAAAGSNDILYKAPPPDRVDAEMSAFIDWLNDKPEMPAAIVASIAHLWFESVHPFSDGNGRVGRAVIEYVFASRARALPFSLSRQIEKDKKAYYAALQDGRKMGRGAIDATAFIVWFLTTLKSAADAGRDEAHFLVRRNQFFMRFGDVMSERQKAVLQTIFAQGRGRLEQGISAKSYSKIGRVSGPTATRDLGAMERAGALRRSESGGRSTVYWINV
jgi:Fic family protein